MLDQAILDRIQQLVDEDPEKAIVAIDVTVGAMQDVIDKLERLKQGMQELY